MNLQDLIQIHDQQQRIDITFNDTRREVTPYVVRHFSLEDKYGFILYSRLNVENADQVIQEQIDYFADLDVDFEWNWFKHDTPFDLHDRLIAHGFEPEEPEALMALDIEHAPSILLQSITLGVRRITDPNEVPSLIKVLEGVWGEPYERLEQRLMKDLVEDAEHLSVYAGYAENQPVSVAWIDFHDNQFAGLWGGSTLEAYRGRGYYTSLLAIRLQEAMSRGIRYLVLDASPMSRSIVEKYDFRFVEYTQPHQYHQKYNM